MDSDNARSRLARSGRGRTATIIAAVAIVSGAATLSLLPRDSAPGGGGPAPLATPSATPVDPLDHRLRRDWAEVDWTATIDPAASVTPLLSSDAPPAFDDGLAASSLPPLAERPSPRYPPARIATDAVWDQVGPGWGVAVFSASLDRLTWDAKRSDDLANVPPTLYLVSPSGTYFRMWQAGDASGWYAKQVEWVDDIVPELNWIVLSGFGPGEGSSSWVEVRDLRTGAIITSETSGEGGGVGTERVVLRHLAGDRVVFFDRIDQWDQSTDTVPEATVVAADGSRSTLALPDIDYTGMKMYAADEGSRMVILAPEWSGTSLFTVDIVDGTITDRTEALRNAGSDCIFAHPVDDNSFAAQCDAYSTIRIVSWDGTVLASSPVADDDAATLASRWGAQGFSATTGNRAGESHSAWVSSFTDAAVGTPRQVLTADQCSGNEHGTIDGPFSLGADRFAFLCGQQGLLAGYDRSSGDVFAIAPQFWPDTGARSALNDYLPFDKEPTT